MVNKWPTPRFEVIGTRGWLQQACIVVVEWLKKQDENVGGMSWRRGRPMQARAQFEALACVKDVTMERGMWRDFNTPWMWRCNNREEERSVYVAARFNDGGGGEWVVGGW